MDIATYAVEAEVEATHWWFVGRRRLFGAELAKSGIKPTDRVLDIGTGTGANLRLLRSLGLAAVRGLDSSDEAIGYCVSKGLGAVQKGDICALPFADESFDFVLATDVIEHVDDDPAAAREIARVLAPGGIALISVPAFPSLWGLQDRQAFPQAPLPYGTAALAAAKGRAFTAAPLPLQLSPVCADLSRAPGDRLPPDRPEERKPNQQPPA